VVELPPSGVPAPAAQRHVEHDDVVSDRA
jgi:hypothetical protein